MLLDLWYFEFTALRVRIAEFVFPQSKVFAFGCVWEATDLFWISACGMLRYHLQGALSFPISQVVVREIQELKSRGGPLLEVPYLQPPTLTT